MIDSYMLRQPAIDLFGDVAITDDDLFDWVAAVAPRWLNERSYENYLRSWDVAGKVRAAKMRGEFEKITARQSSPWHARLALTCIV